MLMLIILLFLPVLVMGGCPKCAPRSLVCYTEGESFSPGEEVMLHVKNIGDGPREVNYFEVYLSAPGSERIYLGRIEVGLEIPRSGEATLAVRLPEDVEPGDYYYFILVSDYGEEVYSSSFSIRGGVDIVPIILGIIIILGAALLATRLR